MIFCHLENMQYFQSIERVEAFNLKYEYNRYFMNLSDRFYYLKLL